MTERPRPITLGSPGVISVTPGDGIVANCKPLTLVVAGPGDSAALAPHVSNLVDELAVSGDWSFAPVAEALQAFVVTHQPIGVAALLDVPPDPIAFLFDQARVTEPGETHMGQGRGGWNTVFILGPDVHLTAGAGADSANAPAAQGWVKVLTGIVPGSGASTTIVTTTGNGTGLFGHTLSTAPSVVHDDGIDWTPPGGPEPLDEVATSQGWADDFDESTPAHEAGVTTPLDADVVAEAIGSVDTSSAIVDDGVDATGGLWETVPTPAVDDRPLDPLGAFPAPPAADDAETDAGTDGRSVLEGEMAAPTEADEPADAIDDKAVNDEGVADEAVEDEAVEDDTADAGADVTNDIVDVNATQILSADQLPIIPPTEVGLDADEDSEVDVDQVADTATDESPVETPADAATDEAVADEPAETEEPADEADDSADDEPVDEADDDAAAEADGDADEPADEADDAAAAEADDEPVGEPAADTDDESTDEPADELVPEDGDDAEGEPVDEDASDEAQTDATDDEPTDEDASNDAEDLTAHEPAAKAEEPSSDQAASDEAEAEADVEAEAEADVEAEAEADVETEADAEVEAEAAEPDEVDEMINATADAVHQAAMTQQMPSLADQAADAVEPGSIAEAAGVTQVIEPISIGADAVEPTDWTPPEPESGPVDSPQLNQADQWQEPAQPEESGEPTVEPDVDSGPSPDADGSDSSDPIVDDATEIGPDPAVEIVPTSVLEPPPGDEWTPPPPAQEFTAPPTPEPVPTPAPEPTAEPEATIGQASVLEPEPTSNETPLRGEPDTAAEAEPDTSDWTSGTVDAETTAVIEPPPSDSSGLFPSTGGARAPLGQPPPPSPGQQPVSNEPPPPEVGLPFGSFRKKVGGSLFGSSPGDEPTEPAQPLEPVPEPTQSVPEPDLAALGWSMPDPDDVRPGPPPEEVVRVDEVPQQVPDSPISAAPPWPDIDPLPGNGDTELDPTDAPER